MFKELLSLFRSGESLQDLGNNFAVMMGLSYELLRRAGEAYFLHTVSPEERADVQQQDVQVNKLQRRIRKQVLAHLTSSGNRRDLPYCLVLISLVKDVERVGDYAKDLVNLVDLTIAPLPNDENVALLAEVRTRVEEDYEAARALFAKQDRGSAVRLIRRGRELVELCEELIKTASRARYPAGVAASVALAARYYERVAGHLLNVLSSLVMPLHKLDYYDEKDIERAVGEQRPPSE